MIKLIFLFFIELIWISKILANDCIYYEKAVKYLDSTYQEQYSKVTNCCSLNEITCDNNQHITEIKIINVNHYDVDISNAITEFENLQYLTSLELSNIESNGNIPQSVFNLKNLKTLIIKDNNYFNIIPDNFDKLINLEKIDLSNNYFKGSFPKSICGLKKLKYLNFDTNRLDGTIPYDCKNLKELNLLNLKENNLHGYVPLLPNLVNCNYFSSDLCYLPEATCKPKESEECLQEDVTSTNLENGNPNPSSNEFKNVKKKNMMGIYLVQY